MAFDAHKNLAISTVATAPSPPTTGTSLTVSATEGGRFPTPPFNVTVWPSGSTPTPVNAEILRVTAIVSDTLTVTRAQEGTTARGIGSGDLIAATVTVKSLTDLESGTFARLDASNIFTATPQQIGPVGNPALVLSDSGVPVDARLWRIQDAFQTLRFSALNDAITVEHNLALYLTRMGDAYIARDVYEKGRAAPMGHWTNVPSNGGLFSALGGGGGTVSLAAYFNQAYMLSGKTMTYTFYVQLTVTGTPLYLRIALPAGILTATNSGGPFVYGNKNGMLTTGPADTYLNLYNDATGGTNWVAGSYYCVGTLPFQIQ